MKDSISTNFKKYTYIAIFTLLASILVAGCTGVGNEKNISTQVNSEKAEYQDLAWMEHGEKYSALVESDLKNTELAQNTQDFKLLAEYGQDLVNDTQNALDGSSQYTVSPKYQEAKTEWELAMSDANSAGQYIVSSANMCLAYGVPVRDLEAEQKIQSLMVSSTGHANRATALLKPTFRTIFLLIIFFVFFSHQFQHFNCFLIQI